MDEEDGRPGARAAQTGVPSDRSSSLGWVQTGHPDAPRGVPTLSLPINPNTLKSTSFVRRADSG